MAENLTALYLRLSRDDGNVTDSESIVNQKAFLLQYARENSLNVVEIFSDDGYSGLSFDRPEFNRMIKMIEEKKNKHSSYKRSVPTGTRLYRGG